MSFDYERASAREIRDQISRSPHAVDASAARDVRQRLAQIVLSEPDEALQTATVLLQRAKPGGVAEAWAHRSMGDAAVYLSRFDEARSSYESSVQIARKSDENSLLGQVLVSLVGVLSHQGRSAEAKICAEEAEARLRRENDRPYLARLFANLGNASFHIHDYENAYQRYALAEEEYEAIGAEDPMRVVLHINFGNACDELSRIAEARSLFVRAETRSRELGLELLVAQAQSNLAVLEALRGDYRKAIDLLESSEVIFEREEAPELLAPTQLTRAEIYNELGMSDEAADLADAAGKTYRGEELELDAALCDLARARALREEGRAKESASLFQAVREFYHSRGLRIGEALAQLEMSRANEDLREGLALAQSAATTFEERGLIDLTFRAQIAIARLFCQLKEHGSCHRILSEMASSLDRVTVRERADYWHVRGQSARQMGNRRQALRDYLRAIQAADAAWVIQPGTELGTTIARKGPLLRSELITLLTEDPKLSAATLFRILDQAQSQRTLLARGAGATWLRHREELASQHRQLQKMETELFGESSPSPSPETLAPIRTKIAELEKSLLSAVRASSLRSPAQLGSDAGSVSTEATSGGVRLRKIQTQLRPDQILVEYFLSDQVALALVVRHDTAFVCRLAARPDQISRQLRRWHLQLESFALGAKDIPNLPFLRAAADEMLSAWFQLLLEPVLEHALLLEGELLISPQGLLHQIPFEALRVGHDYLDVNWRVRRVAGARALQLSDSKSSGGKPTELVLAAVTGGPDGASRESAIRPFLSAERKLDPTSQDILAGLQAARSVHWITHGEFRADNPLFSQFLTRDGAIIAADLRGRSLSMDRLVLSACESGRVVVGRSDDLAGVIVVFLESGVRMVIASHWRVHDDATVEWMECFYEELAHSDEAEAMRKAQQSVRRAWPHPFYWAAFGVYS